jgi:hypothetical protein
LIIDVLPAKSLMGYGPALSDEINRDIRLDTHVKLKRVGADVPAARPRFMTREQCVRQVLTSRADASPDVQSFAISHPT